MVMQVGASDGSVKEQQAVQLALVAVQQGVFKVGGACSCLWGFTVGSSSISRSVQGPCSPQLKVPE
jgi:hypothetical protein